MAVGRPDFHALPGFIRECHAVMKHDSTERMQDIRDLLYRLRRPQRFTDPLPPPLPEAMGDEDWAIAPDVFGERAEAVPPHPEIAVAEAEERDGLREELRELIEQEISLNGETWEKALDEHEAPLAPSERDRLAAAAHKDTVLMRRDESSCSREFWRTANMLMKFQAQDKSEVKQESEVRSPISEVKQESGVRSPESEVENPEELIIFASQGPDAGATVEFPSSEQAVSASDFGPRTSDLDMLTPSSKNAGASGDIHENKGRRKKVSAVRRPVRGGNGAPVLPLHAEESGKKSEPRDPEQGHLPQNSRAAA